MRPLFEQKNKAVRMRLKGMSYSQIKNRLRVSKSTLSAWLAPYPLSPEKIRELRDFNPQRIENYRNTMARKRQDKLNLSLERAKEDIGSISKRDLFILGFALYWAEGAKTKRSSLYFANTDPSMLKVYLKWLQNLGVPKKKVRLKLHIYRDMKEKEVIDFWSKTLGVRSDQFRKTYVKRSRLVDLTYKNGFGHGTCNIMFENSERISYVLMGIKHITDEVMRFKLRA